MDRFSKLYQSLSAYLPSTSAACPVEEAKAQSCSPTPSSSAAHLTSCQGDGSSSWLLGSFPGVPMWRWDFGFSVCSSLAVGCPAPQLCPVQRGAGQPGLQCWTGFLQTVPKYLVFIQTRSKPKCEISSPFQAQSIICSHYFVISVITVVGFFLVANNNKGMHIQSLLNNNMYPEFFCLAATISKTTPKCRTYYLGKCISRKKII